MKKANDPVNHPSHYTSHPSGVECIQITEHMGFCLGNALKYIWRAGLKDDPVEDIEKAMWYLAKELTKSRGNTSTINKSILPDLGAAAGLTAYGIRKEPIL